MVLRKNEPQPPRRNPGRLFYSKRKYYLRLLYVPEREGGGQEPLYELPSLR